jgi:hypothetical protein
MMASTSASQFALKALAPWRWSGWASVADIHAGGRHCGDRALRPRVVGCAYPEAIAASITEES